MLMINSINYFNKTNKKKNSLEKLDIEIKIPVSLAHFVSTQCGYFIYNSFSR